MMVFGPYERSDGRSIIVKYDGTRTTSQSYPRYLMEQHLGRVLEDWEQIDHIDDNPRNNKITNLQILTIDENNKKASKGVSIVYLDCPQCNKLFVCLTKRFKVNQKHGRTTYCSRKCSGIAGGIASGKTRARV